ncbi:hypothetical protein JW977_00475 [Candidatus Falkowbacteria bacterium]|nr:hypothetical protein [Candidatus Falkowbacteria bacterium]
MTIFSLSGIFIAITCGITSAIVLIKGYKKSHYVWGIFLLSVFVWGVGDFFIGRAVDETSALFWWKFAYVGVILIPTFLFHFTQLFLNKVKGYQIAINYILGIVLLYLLFYSDLFISSVKYSFNEFFYLTSPSLVYNLFLIWFVSVFLYVLINAYLAFSKSTGIEKIHTKYFFVGILISVFGGLFDFLPVYNYNIYPILNFTLPIGASIFVYAIMRHRFMDIRFIIKRSIIFTILVFVITGSYALLTYIISSLFQDIIGTRSMVFNGAITAIAIVLSFEPLKKLLSKWTDSFLFKGSYNPQELLTEITTAISTTLDLKKVLNTINQKLFNAFHSTLFSIYLYDDDKDCFEEAVFIGKRTSTARCLTAQELLKYQLVLKKYSQFQNLIVTDELKKENETKSSPQLVTIIKELENNGIGVTLPVFLHKKPIGIFFLGPKKSGDYYSREDLNVLEIVAAQSATAIENSSLYKEVNDLNENLQKKVDEQTKDIVEKNKKLERLLKIKSEFLDIASHQLRTPVSVICGILDMFKSGTMDKLPKEKQMTFISNAFSKGQKLNAVINDILDASDLDEKELDLKNSLEDLDFSALVNNIVTYNQPEAEQKKIKISADIAKDIMVKGDKKYLEQAVGNLVDNAVKYTPENKEVFIKLSIIDKLAQLEIKDSGIGIPEKEQKILFQKFSRASNAKELHTDGSGLGLFIVKKVINAHPGAKIWFESKEGQGTTFFVQLLAI